MEKFIQTAKKLGHDIERLKNGEEIVSTLVVNDIHELKALLNHGEDTSETRANRLKKFEAKDLTDLDKTERLVQKANAFIFADYPLSDQEHIAIKDAFPMEVECLSADNKIIGNAKPWKIPEPNTNHHPRIYNVDTFTIEPGAYIEITNCIVTMSIGELVKYTDEPPKTPSPKGFSDDDDNYYDIGIFGAQGSIGATGQSGQPGQNGTKGLHGKYGTNGADGGKGSDGETGENGQPSLTANINIQKISFKNNKPKDLSNNIDDQNNYKITIATQSGSGGLGGSGGQGGSGGNGGDGGAGHQRGCNPGTNGGSGGNGGNGGDGGQGGQGGNGTNGDDIYIKVSEDQEDKINPTDSPADPGKPGIAGVAGIGGKPGTGGNGGHQGSCPRGKNGADGNPGKPGDPGKIGTPGVSYGSPGTIYVNGKIPTK